MLNEERQLLARIEQLEAALNAATQNRLELKIALQRFGSDTDRLFSRYRSERAWWVMLRIRKAYALLFRGGIRGWWRFARWAVTGFAAGDDLRAYEIAVPDFRNYLPDGEGTLQISPERPAAGVFDVVILPVIEFNYRVGRPQHIAVQLAQKGHRVYWVNPTRLPPREDAPSYSMVPIRTNLLEVHLPGEPLDLHGGPLTDSARLTLCDSLDRLCREQRIQSACVIVQFPFWREAAMAIREAHGACVVYDCMDDWRHWSTEPRISAWGLKQEELLARDCDVLTVSAAALQERFAAMGLKPILIRNGVDFDWFTRPQTSSPLKEIPSPVIGYYGSIAPWFDVELMAQVAASRPAYSFILIGQVHGTDVGALKSCPNVHFLGERHYRELPSFLERFDVAVVPFRLNDLIRSVDPVKVYEYLSRGKPVVATSMPELTICGDLIARADTAEAFAKEIDNALADPVRGRLARIAFARENTWSKRIEQLEHAVSRTLDPTARV